MASTNVIPLYSTADITGVGDYLSDGEHPNHKTHKLIGPIQPGIASLREFVSRVGYGVRLLNRERRLQNQILIVAYWMIWRFEDRSDLTEIERGCFESNAVTRFAQGAPTYGYWHIDWLLETCDFNLIIPSFCGTDLPRLRRFVDRSLYSECRQFADEQVLSLNEGRRDAGKPALLTASDAHVEALLTRRWETVERKVAKFAVDSGTKVSARTLPTILVSLGLEEDEDWVMEGSVSIRFRKRGKGRRKWFRIRLEDFFKTTAVEINRLAAVKTARRRIQSGPLLTESSPPVHYTPLTSSLDVIQPTKTYEK